MSPSYGWVIPTCINQTNRDMMYTRCVPVFDEPICDMLQNVYLVVGGSMAIAVLFMAIFMLVRCFQFCCCRKKKN